MGQRTVRFSDLSGELILEDEQFVRLVVVEHPAVTNGPVQIEAAVNEVKAVEHDRLNVVVFDCHLPGEEPERFYMTVERFDALAHDGKMTDILAAASTAKAPTRRSDVNSRLANEKVDYASSAHAGEPHRGRTTEQEKQYVRDHFDEVNERLRTKGLRVIDLRDPEMVERYGLEELVKERGI